MVGRVTVCGQRVMATAAGKADTDAHAAVNGDGEDRDPAEFGVLAPSVTHMHQETVLCQLQKWNRLCVYL